MKDIQRKYQQLAARIADDWSGHHLPPPVMHYYLLVELIGLGSFEAFFKAYGLQPIEERIADQGKDEFLNLGSLTQFELDSIEILAARIDERESGVRVR